MRKGAIILFGIAAIDIVIGFAGVGAVAFYLAILSAGLGAGLLVLDRSRQS